MDVMQNPLKKELKFFKHNKSRFIKTYLGQFVLIKNETLIGSYTTEEEAYKAGIEKFGNTPFLIKQVLTDEQKLVIPALMVGLIRNANT